MTYDWETMLAFEKLKTQRALTPAPKPKKKNQPRKKLWNKPPIFPLDKREYREVEYDE